jgi:replicative DNA helicase
MSIEKLILGHLIYTEPYSRRVLPFLKPDYFTEQSDKIAFELIHGFVTKYNATPTREALLIDLGNKENLSEGIFNETKETINSLTAENTEEEWLVDQTEKFCQDRSMFNAVQEAIGILDDPEQAKESIRKIISDALAVSFNSNVGLDYLEDTEQRFDFYNSTEEKLPFSLDIFNKITKGGLPKKSLNIIMAGTGVGKSLTMGYFAAEHLLMGKNVLYITMEMSEERIAERIDAHLLNMTTEELDKVPRETFFRRIQKVKQKTVGKLIIKEFPTAGAGAAHFRHLINEIRLKKNFTPDIIYIDYLNICMSTRVKMGSNVNSYNYVKSIAEELRGLAVEFDVPLVTATQVNRSGFQDSDPDLADTSDSFGLPMTADWMVALVSTEELEAVNQIMVKQLKTRYNDPNYYRRFVVGVDRPKMRLYTVEESAQTLLDSGAKDEPVEPKSKFRSLFK